MSDRVKAGIFVFLAMIIVSGSCFATSWTTAGEGDWFESSNWNSGVPNSGVNANIDITGTAQIDGGDAYTNFLSMGGTNDSNSVLEINSGSLRCLTGGNIANRASNISTITVNGGTLDFDAEFRVTNGTGNLNFNGGVTNFKAGYARLPNYPGSKCNYSQTDGIVNMYTRTQWKEDVTFNISGGILNVYGTHFSFDTNSATSTMSGGTIYFDDANTYGLLLADAAGSQHTFTQSGGVITAPNKPVKLGNNGTVTYHFDGGTLDCDYFYINSLSVMDMEVGATLVINGDVRATINDYIADDKLTAKDDTGTFSIDYSISNIGKTTVRAYDPFYNGPPNAMAGDDKNITLPINSVQLFGQGSDDGKPDDPGELSYEWTTVSGPYSVSFDNAYVSTPTATFGGVGTYVLELTVSDGELTDSDQVTVTVNPAVNQKPIAYAGPDQTIIVPAYDTQLAGRYQDDGIGTIITGWAVQSKPAGANVVFDDISDLNTTVSFDTFGEYVLSLLVHDGLLFSTDTVTINFTQVPELSPAVITQPTFLFDMDQEPSDAAASFDSVIETMGNTAGYIVRPETGLPAHIAGAKYFTGNAWDFAGVEANIAGLVANDKYLRLGDIDRADGMSFAFWVNAENLSASERLAGAGWGGVFDVARISGDNLSGNFAGAVSVNTLGGPVLDGSWHHVAFVADFTSTSNNVKVYVDGVLNNSTSYNFASSFYEWGRPDHMIHIGARSLAGASAFWPGAIDDFAMYDYALDPVADIPYLVNGLDAALQYKMDDASPVDVTGNTTAAIAGGDPPAVEIGPAGDALGFAGVSGAISVASNATTAALGDTAGTDGLSIAFWMNQQYSAGVVGERISGFGSVWDIYTGSESSMGKLIAQVGSATISHDNSVVDLYDGKWHHVAIAADFGSSTDNVVMYVDGYRHAVGSASLASFADASSNIIIGADSALANGFGGMLDEFIVKQNAMVSKEIAYIAPRNAPEVEAGRTVTVPLAGDTASISADVVFDHMPSTVSPSYTWSVVSGPSNVVFDNANALSTTATFSPVGKYSEYILKIEASDGGLIGSDEVAVVFYEQYAPATRQLPDNPIPNVHPRVLFTADEIPGIRDRGNNLPLAKACVTELRNTLYMSGNLYSGSGMGAVYDQLKIGNDSANVSPYVWEPGDEEGNSANSYMRGNYRLYGQILGGAYIALVEDDQAKLTELATALAAGASAHSRTYKPDYGNKLTHDANVDLALAYDILYNHMDETQRSYCRDMISAQTSHRQAYGYMAHDADNSTNWKTHHDHIMVAALAIEGEDGYDKRLLDSNIRKLRKFFTRFGIHESGYPHESWGYFEFGMIWGAPASLAVARRDENFFETARLYKAMETAFHELSPWANRIYSHHDGSSWDQSSIFSIMNYMYQNDKMVDHFVQSNYLDIPWPRWDKKNLRYAFFAQPAMGGYPDVASAAAQNSLPVTKFCKDRGMVNTRSGWSSDAVRLDFECRGDLYYLGHVHNDRNHITLYGLERVWISDDKYPQLVYNDAHSTVLIDGVGQAGSTTNLNSGGGVYWPSMPGKFLDYEDNDVYTMGVGDAKAAYKYSKSAIEPTPSPYTWADFFYDVEPEEIEPWQNESIGMISFHTNIERAFRTAMLVRGDRPYVLVIDDIEKDNSPHEYEWTAPVMPSNDFVKVSGNTTDMVIRHWYDDDAGDPRLLVRALQADGGAQNWELKNKSFGSDSLGTFIALKRSSVVTPNFKMLLMPHYEGETLPITTWVDSDTLNVEIDGQIDTFDFTMGLDGRTYVEMMRNGCMIMPGDGDISGDGAVNLVDVAQISAEWLNCMGLEDLSKIVYNWLE